LGRLRVNLDVSTVSRRLDGILDHIGKHLAQLGGESFHFTLKSRYQFDFSPVLGNRLLNQRQDTFEQLRELHLGSCARFAVQAQHVLADLSDPLYLPLSCLDQLSSLGLRANLLVEKEENVAHRIERVVDFVRDGSGETTSESQAFVRL